MNQSIYAKVICDSVSPLGVRLSSVEVQLPRSILPQVLMHRIWSRSCESLRARPVKSKLEEVEKSPFVPLFRKGQKGMQPAGYVDYEVANQARAEVDAIYTQTVTSVRKLAELGVAKEIANRYLEPFAYQKMLITTTDFKNFFRLRTKAGGAQEEIDELAAKVREAVESSVPSEVGYGQWHLPYYEHDRRGWNSGQEKLLLGSAARCARVSYVNHEGKKSIEQDIELALKLKADNHSNVFEHQCTPAPDRRRYANLKGWVSQRYRFEQSGDLLDAEG